MQLRCSFDVDTVFLAHYSDVIMSAMYSQITGVSIVSSSVCSGADQKKYQSSVLLAFVRGPVNSLYKRSVTRENFTFYDVTMHGKPVEQIVEGGGGEMGRLSTQHVAPV